MRYILITFATFLDFLKVCFGSFVELEWNGMELIISISRAKDKVRAGFFVIIVILKVPKFLEQL